MACLAGREGPNILVPELQGVLHTKFRAKHLSNRHDDFKLQREVCRPSLRSAGMLCPITVSRQGARLTAKHCLSRRRCYCLPYSSRLCAAQHSPVFSCCRRWSQSMPRIAQQSQARLSAERFRTLCETRPERGPIPPSRALASSGGWAMRSLKPTPP